MMMMMMMTINYLIICQSSGSIIREVLFYQWHMNSLIF